MKNVNEALDAGDYTVVKELTPDEIRWIDALNADRVGQEEAFRVAMNTYMNKVSDTRERMEGFYETVSGYGRYDRERGTLSVIQHNGRVCLVQIKED